MGVPTLTLTGKTPAGRQTESILAHVKLEGFVADTPDEFVTLATSWAQRRDELVAIRLSLRNQVQSSPTRDPDLISKALVLALRIMWHRWCENRSVDFIDVSNPTS